MLWSSYTERDAGFRPFKSKTEHGGYKRGMRRKISACLAFLTCTCARLYHLTLVQSLMLGGQAITFDYCNFMLTNLDQKPSLLCSILKTDESTFTRLGIVNGHNRYYWFLENPHIPRTVRHQITGQRICGAVYVELRLLYPSSVMVH